MDVVEWVAGKVDDGQVSRWIDMDRGYGCEQNSNERYRLVKWIGGLGRVRSGWVGKRNIGACKSTYCLTKPKKK